MSVLVDHEIKRAVQNGHIVIYPYNEKNLSVNSYDITLGDRFYFENALDEKYNIWSEEATKNHWIPCRPAYDPDLRKSVLWIPPNTRILGHTDEVIGTRSRYTTILKARSSVGRSGISICMCAGSGDIGYVNRWTLEITNHSVSAVPLLPGMRIGQILFLSTNEPEKEYHGKYNGVENSAEKIYFSWQPEEMLPKIYRDDVEV